MIDLNKCKKLIEQALEYANGTHTTDDIFRGIEKKQFQLWDAEKSCLITEILEYPQKKVCHVFLGAGDLEEIMGMHESVITWAKACGCTELTVSGRAGWQKPLKKENWKHAYTTLYKEI